MIDRLPLNDQALLDMESQLLDIEDILDGVTPGHSDFPAPQELQELESRIAEIVAESPPGLLIKVRRLGAALSAPSGSCLDQNLRTTLASIARLHDLWVR